MALMPESARLGKPNATSMRVRRLLRHIPSCRASAKSGSNGQGSRSGMGEGSGIAQQLSEYCKYFSNLCGATAERRQAHYFVCRVCETRRSARVRRGASHDAGRSPLGAPPWRFSAGGRASISGIASGSVQRAPRSQVIMPGGRCPGPPEPAVTSRGRRTPLPAPPSLCTSNCNMEIFQTSEISVHTNVHTSVASAAKETPCDKTLLGTARSRARTDPFSW